VQETFSAIYNLDIKHFNAQQAFDYLFADHEQFKIGELIAYNIPTPGHTPACLSYVTGDAVLLVIPYLCLIMERHIVIFRRAVHQFYLIRSKGFIN